MKGKASPRHFGSRWKDRLEAARKAAANKRPRLSSDDVERLQRTVRTIDVSSPRDLAFLWSGKDIPTGISVDETVDDGPFWSDKLACHEAKIFRDLNIGICLEDTPGGQFLLAAGLDYADDDALAAVVRGSWNTLSERFVQAAAGRIEIIGEGALENGVLRKIEIGAVLANQRITSVNGLDRALLPMNAAEAYPILRRWDVERSRRYHAFIASLPDATDAERASALDDFRECRLWYEQDFFEQLGPDRELPALPAAVSETVDQARDALAWKYSMAWRALIRKE